MSDNSVASALEEVYASLHKDNEDIDARLAALKSAMVSEGLKEAPIDPTRLPQNNRQGRKVLQSYFRRHGVKVAFA